MAAVADRPTFHICRFDLDGTTVVAPLGEVDLKVQEPFGACLQACEGDVIVDLSSVTFFDSSAISVLVAQRRRLNGTLRVCNASENIRRIFAITGVQEFLS